MAEYLIQYTVYNTLLFTQYLSRYSINSIGDEATIDH